MLTHLSIRSLTLVDQLELEFSGGMSAITGETGAGKSILLGALGLALGDRADASMIAPDANRTEINASFEIDDNEDARAWLKERELLEDSECILRRVVSKDGRSRAFINGTTTTLAELRKLAQMLLDIHSQHEHQSLLRKETHRRLLDEYAGLTSDVEEVTALFDDISELKSTLDSLQSNADEQSAKVQLLSYQVEELNELAITAGETVELADEQKHLANADESHRLLTEALALCHADSDGAASSQLSRALLILEKLADERITGIKDLIASASIQLDEAMRDLDGTLDQFAADPERLQQVENRLSAIYEAARKHKVQPDELEALCTTLQSELDDIVNADEKIETLKTEIAAIETTYLEKATKLGKARRKAAKKLQDEVSEQLQNLGMNGANFSVCLNNSTPSRFGTDDIEFRVSTLPGSDPGALSKIASGGELSRISLAIQVITARTSRTSTLVFDEVDVGVGGATAEVVGALLRRLGQDAQVICVTHLPQVAAQSHHHYVVEKTTDEQSASTTVNRLSAEQKVDEIARMLGGVRRTDESIAHAESMIEGAGSS